MRTGTECKQRKPPNTQDQDLSTNSRVLSDVPSVGTSKLEDFQANITEQAALRNLKQTASLYTMQKLAAASNQQVYLDFQSYFGLINNHSPPESSNVAYLSVIDQKVDDKLTLLEIINRLHEEFIVKLNKQWLLLEMDGAVYHKIQSIKTEYGKELSWLTPFPGNWHCLKNYQEVLMKIYYDAGLHELAVASGYPPNSIKNCTIFSRTHDFLSEAWESFYQHFLTLFLQNVYNPDSSTTEHRDVLAHVSQWLQSFPTATTEQQCHRNLQELLSDVMEKHSMFVQRV